MRSSLRLSQVQPEFKLADLWVGVRWKYMCNKIDIWVCLVPWFPIHFTVVRDFYLEVGDE